MKRGRLLHSEISRVIADMGHTDSLVISDAGLPVSLNGRKIDLCLTKGIPAFIETLKVILSDLCVERVLLAEEITDYNQIMYKQILTVLSEYREESGYAADLSYVSHEKFKAAAGEAKAVIRTGEMTPYANIILYSGVVFS